MAAAFGFALFLVCGVVFFGILGGLLLHRIIGWYVEGSIGGLECFVIGGLYIGLVISITALSIPSILLFSAVLAGVLLLSKGREHAAARRFSDERIRRYREAIESDPRNMAARSRLAQELYREGALQQAIEELAEVVRFSPEDREEMHRLNQWIQERDERQSSPITCPSCGHRNPPDRKHCENCESLLSTRGELKRWLASGGMRQIAITWAVMLAVSVLIMLVLSGMSLAGRILLVAVLMLIFIFAGVFHAYRSL